MTNTIIHLTHRTFITINAFKWFPLLATISLKGATILTLSKEANLVAVQTKRGAIVPLRDHNCSLRL